MYRSRRTESLPRNGSATSWFKFYLWANLTSFSSSPDQTRESIQILWTKKSSTSDSDPKSQVLYTNTSRFDACNRPDSHKFVSNLYFILSPQNHSEMKRSHGGRMISSFINPRPLIGWIECVASEHLSCTVYSHPSHSQTCPCPIRYYARDQLMISRYSKETTAKCDQGSPQSSSSSPPANKNWCRLKPL